MWSDSVRSLTTLDSCLNLSYASFPEVSRFLERSTGQYTRKTDSPQLQWDQKPTLKDLGYKKFSMVGIQSRGVSPDLDHNQEAKEAASNNGSDMIDIAKTLSEGLWGNEDADPAT